MADLERDSGSSPEHVSFNFEDIIIEQRWAGVVEDVNGDKLSVRLTALPANSEESPGMEEPTETEEFTEIDRSQLSERDQSLAGHGAQFEWIVGYADDTSGRRIGISVIQFDHFEAYKPSDEEIAEAAREGAEAAERLKAGQTRTGTF